MFLSDREIAACVKEARRTANYGSDHDGSRAEGEHMASMIVFHLIQRAVAQKKGEPDSAS